MVMPLSPSLRLLLPPLPAWGHGNSSCLLIFFPSKKRFLNGLVSRAIPSSDSDDSSSKPLHSQIGYDPSEELLGLDVDLPSRNAISGAPRPRSWFGPNGQYIRELPCPSCRGRGYTPCTECGIERSRMDCSQCSGKGIVTCQRCSGECVIWEESIDERPWEKARSISPFKMKEDDEVDNLDIKLDVKKKSKRVYQSSPEVSLKISRSLKSLNAKTGLFTKRMKMIHQNPTLHAQRVAAIKRVKGDPAARKRASEAQKAFFSDPENRHKRSIAMKGVTFYCSYCGQEGHRRHYCPELKDSLIDRRFRCRICGEKGHNRRTCRSLGLVSTKERVARLHCCTVCGRHGHNQRTCPEKIGERLLANPSKKADQVPLRKLYVCGFCQQKGHNVRTCLARTLAALDQSLEGESDTTSQ